MICLASFSRLHVYRTDISCQHCHMSSYLIVLLLRYGIVNCAMLCIHVRYAFSHTAFICVDLCVNEVTESSVFDVQQN